MIDPTSPEAREARLRQLAAEFAAAKRPRKTPRIPPTGARWVDFLNYFQQLLRSIPAAGEPDILSYPNEPWKELAEWEMAASEADGEATSAIRHLLNTGTWPRAKRRDTFWFRVEHRVQNAKDICNVLAMQLEFPSNPPADAVPPPTLPAVAIVEWLLVHIWNSFPWLSERFKPNPWSNYP